MDKFDVKQLKMSPLGVFFREPFSSVYGIFLKPTFMHVHTNIIWVPTGFLGYIGKKLSGDNHFGILDFVDRKNVKKFHSWEPIQI